MRHRRRGMALLFTLSVGVILAILAVSLIGLYFGDFHSQRMQQQAIQAYWNARSGVEHYCDARQLPDKGVYKEFDCQVASENRDLIFTGHSGAMSRRIRLIDGDPARRVDLP